MARLILTTPGEDADIGGEVDVIGTDSGGETITTTRGDLIFDASFNSGGDTIVLPGDSFDYTIRFVGSRAILTNGTTTVSIPVGIAATTITFDDGSLALRIDPEADALLLGDQVVTSEAEPIGEPPSETLVLDQDTTLAANNAVIRGFDRVELESGRGVEGDNGRQFDINLGDDNAPPGGGVLTIDASTLAADTDGSGPLEAETAEIDASGVTAFSLAFTGGAGDDLVTGTELADVIQGGLGDDRLFGGDGADSISGDAGSDIIDGGDGGDALSGGAGVDVFQYTALSNSPGGGRDTISDFATGVDKINAMFIDTPAPLDLLAFKGNANGLAAAELLLDADDSNLDIVFDTSNSVLWYDLDDNGQLDSNDLAIVLAGVASVQGIDVFDGAQHFG